MSLSIAFSPPVAYLFICISWSEWSDQ